MRSTKSLRNALMLIVGALATSPASAQSAPSSGFDRTVTYPNAPGLRPLDSASPAAIIENAGNFVRWLRAQIASGESSAPLGSEEPGASGYFAVVEPGFGVTAIGAGAYLPHSGAMAGLAFDGVSTSCFATGQTLLNPQFVVYLGPVWRAEWDAIATELAKNSDSPGAPRSVPPGKVKWERGPMAEDFANEYPLLAQRDEVEGLARVMCRIGADRSLACLSWREEPANYGFGAATVRAFAPLVVAPGVSDQSGAPAAGACVTLAIRYTLPDHPNRASKD